MWRIALGEAGKLKVRCMHESFRTHGTMLFEAPHSVNTIEYTSFDSNGDCRPKVIFSWIELLAGD